MLRIYEGELTERHARELKHRAYRMVVLGFIKKDVEYIKEYRIDESTTLQEMFNRTISVILADKRELLKTSALYLKTWKRYKNYKGLQWKL